jgi:glycosyltransferase involved in cell wall biosynthesis
MTEFPSVSVQSGPAIHTRFLYETMTGRGHDVTVMGPDTTQMAPLYAEKTQLYRGRPYPTHPKVTVPMPGAFGDMLNAPEVDVVHSQTNMHMVHYAYWMRNMWQIPVLNTHTVHLPTHSHLVLSDKLYKVPFIRNIMRRTAENMERNFAKLYNEGDCLIVQSKHFVQYWRDRGVTIPIEVQGRPIDPRKFSADPGADPYPSRFRRGKRLFVACRHDREKSLDQLIRIFDQHIAPNDSEITLTLAGNGFDHANLVAQADRSAYRDRILFPGELGHGALNSWYRYADVFAYTSVSETFGNVVNEALWCGIPVVALDDKMGVAHQMHNEVNGYLLDPSAPDVEAQFGERCVRLCTQDLLRKNMGRKAEALCIEASHPDNVAARFERIYAEAIEHCRTTVPRPLAKKSRFRQFVSLGQRLARWSFYTSLLLLLSHITTRFGKKRTEGIIAPMPAKVTFEPQVAAGIDTQVEAQWRAGA